MDEYRPPDFKDFICRCSPDSKMVAEEMRKEVRRRLSAGSDELAPVEVTDDNELTRIVVSLNHDFGARITNIGTEMWSGVTAEAYDGSFKTYVQCDWVEDGIAATWKAFADRKEQDAVPGQASGPEELPASGGPGEGDGGGEGGAPAA